MFYNFIFAVVMIRAQRSVQRVLLAAEQALTLSYAKLELQRLTVPRLPPKPFVQPPSWQEAEVCVQRAEKDDAFLVHIRQQVIEVCRAAAAGIAELNGPALQNDLTVSGSVPGQLWAGVC